MAIDVCMYACTDYEPAHVRSALDLAVAPFLPEIRPGMKIAVKTNMVSAMDPEKAATTHPAVLRELCNILTSRGAQVVIGDSPGNLFNLPVLHHAYRVCGLESLVSGSVRLNEDLSITDISFPEAAAAKQFSVTSYLLDADMIINCCKLKTHGMMNMTCAAKNMFGSIPGTMKPEYHFRFPDPDVFSDMIVDLSAYLKPVLCVCDAVTGMEGNGPTQGTPRDIGLIMASASPHKLDLAAAHVLSLDPQSVPTLRAAMRRGLCPERFEELHLEGDGTGTVINGFLHAAGKRDFQFRSSGLSGKLVHTFLRTALQSRPGLSPKDCIGCGKCASICPAKAIVMKNGKPSIDHSKCIHCFCCQEFCPKGAMRVKRTPVTRFLSLFSKKRAHA